MDIVITKNDIDIMKKEVVSVYNNKCYIIIILFSLFFIVGIIFNIRKKSIKPYVFLWLIPILFLIYIVIRNIHIIDSFFDIYSDYDVMTVNFKIQDDSLIIRNHTMNYQSVIDGKTINKIVYKKHTILIYTMDNKTHTMPNCMNLDELLQKEQNK